MQRLFKLRLEDGDDVVVVESASVNRPPTGQPLKRTMEGTSSTSNDTDSSDDELLSETRAAVKQSSAPSHNKIDNEEKKTNLARPPSAFGLFFRDYEKVLKANRPTITIGELQKLAMQKWESIDSAAKQRYIEENSRLKEEYDKTLATIESNSSSGNRSALPARTCRGFGCSKPAIENKLWDRDFCGAQCVVNYCKDVFNSWVAEQKKQP